MSDELVDFEKRILKNFEASLTAHMQRMHYTLDQMKDVNERLKNLDDRMGRICRMPPHTPLSMRAPSQFRISEPQRLTWSSG